MVAEVGEGGLAHRMAVEYGHDALQLTRWNKDHLRQQEVAEQRGDHLVGLEQHLVGLHVAHVPRHTVRDAVEHHAQLPAGQVAVVVAADEAVGEVLLDVVVGLEAVGEREGLDAADVKVPSNAHAQRVGETGGEQVRWEVRTDGELLLAV